VTCREHSSGLRLQRDDAAAALLLLDDADAIGCWPYKVLRRRLAEKHEQAVCVAADTRGHGRFEEFHYHLVAWCREPSIVKFPSIAEDSDVVIERRMHIADNVRNHGTACQIRKNHIRDLYEFRTVLRPQPRQN